MDYPQIFYIDPPDDLEKVREKIKKTKREKVILVLPEENKNLKSIKALTILKKQAQDLGKKLSIFSTDSYYKRLAEDCGIEVEDSLIGGTFSTKGELSFRPRIRDVLPKTEESPLTLSVNKKQEGKEKAIKQETSVKKKRILSLVIYSLVFIGIAGGVAFSLLWLPKAEVTIIPAGQEIEFSGRFKVEKDANLDVKGRVLPGTLLEKTKQIERTFKATGEEKRVDKARGKITIYNETSSPYRFLPHTRFETEDGKVFRQPAGSDWISIPAGSKESPGTVEIEVEATEAGEEYNIGPTRFTLPGLKGTSLYDKIYAKSTEKMKGGFIGTATVVTQADINRAKEELQKLKQDLISQAKQEILKEVSPNFQSLADGISIDEEITFDKNPGDIAQVFKGRERIIAKFLGFSEEDFQKIIADVLLSKIKKNIEVEEVVSTQQVKYKILKNDIESGIMEIEFEGKEKVAWKITSEQIKKAIKGMSGEDFQKYVDENMKEKIENATLKLWPFWVSKIPEREDRIFVKIIYQ